MGHSVAICARVRPQTCVDVVQIAFAVECIVAGPEIAMVHIRRDQDTVGKVWMMVTAWFVVGGIVLIMRYQWTDTKPGEISLL